jgi:hypothetical protein
MTQPFAVSATAAQILIGLIEHRRSSYASVRIMHAKPDALVAGCRAIVTRAMWAMATEKDDVTTRVGVLSRSYVLFAPGCAFTIGPSSSIDPNYFNEAEMASNVASVRIGR